MIGLILVQHGKGADMGAAFGSGSAGSLFGASGSANFLSRTTAVLAAVFFACTLLLAYFSHARPVGWRQPARTRRSRRACAGAGRRVRLGAEIPAAQRACRTGDARTGSGAGCTGIGRRADPDQVMLSSISAARRSENGCFSG